MLGPLDFCFLLSGGPWSGEEQRREGAAFPGEERLRRWGLGWGKWRGGRAAPVEGLGGGWGARNWRHRGERRPAVVCSGAAALRRPWVEVAGLGSSIGAR